MKAFSLFLCLFFAAGKILAQPSPEAPPSLKEWQGWVLWDVPKKNSPPDYNAQEKRNAIWVSELSLDLKDSGGSFESRTTVFDDSWVALPGKPELWPQEVRVNGKDFPVLQQNNAPALFLEPGEYRIQGKFSWSSLPQNLPVPQTVGILRLRLSDKEIDVPSWSPDGTLWLRRDRVGAETAQNFLSTKIFACIEDGIPIWLVTEIELIVSGKSREENLGTLLPEGWKLAKVESPIPVAADDSGNVKAQVRSGKWTIRFRSFRLDDPKNISFSKSSKPAAEDILVGLKANPDFRMLEVTGSPLVDVSQTTFPASWRNLPVYRWNTASPFLLEERMRGKGQQKPPGLNIQKEWWLEESGNQVVFRDNITGGGRETWRLDAAPGTDLGSVRSEGNGQLITRNPSSGLPGVEIRTNQINLEATGTIGRTPDLSASGWNADADSVRVKWNLPPGWRLFSLHGADWVQGDWLTAWSLLDLFLLLLFSLSVLRLHGLAGAALAFLAFALSYQEPDAPRYLWLLLLLPLALLRVLPAGKLQKIAEVWKWATALLLVLFLTPFLFAQIQQAIYPQLEKHSSQGLSENAIQLGDMDTFAFAANEAMPPPPQPQRKSREKSEALYASMPASLAPAPRAGGKSADISNMLYDSKAKIQTGPGIPEWSWRTVSFGWDGPVQTGQTVRPILISVNTERVLTILRVLSLIALGGLLLRSRNHAPAKKTNLPPPLPTAAMTAVLFLALSLFNHGTANAEFPSPELLKEYKERLSKPAEVFPNTAEIPFVSLSLNEKKLRCVAEIHTGTRTSVPLPGKLPAWSPLSVSVDGKPQSALRRNDGYLWVVLEPGVHKVEVSGTLGDAAEWEWSFLLRPRKISVDAPGWSFSGIQENGVPEQQIFFSRQQKKQESEAIYDRQDYQPLVAVERTLEIGLVWQVRTTVTRLSPTGKAISLQLPLLENERVLTPNAILKNGLLEVRLGAQSSSYSWQSELPFSHEILLRSRKEDSWVERWKLHISPVWNATTTGLPPVFDEKQKELIPSWNPWPGESVSLSLSRPEAIPGSTVTVNRATQSLTIGQRQTMTNLLLSVRSSMGEDFSVTLPQGAEVTALSLDGKPLPARIENQKTIVSLHPGDQIIALSWKVNRDLETKIQTQPVALSANSANISTQINLPNDRWVLAVEGPLRGPAVRFWGILLAVVLCSWILGNIPASPLGKIQWTLLGLGLTQVPLPAALAVIAWLFFLVWRGKKSFLQGSPLRFKFLQIVLALTTAVALCVFVGVVAAGLLGDPEMFILGNASSRTCLKWFQPECGMELPTPSCWAVSVWWYRLLMLAWALWLAFSLLRWLQWGWQQFNFGGIWNATEKTEQKETLNP